MDGYEIREILDEDGKKVGECEYLNSKLHSLSRVRSPGGVPVLNAQMSNGKHQSWWNNGVSKEEGEYWGRGHSFILYAVGKTVDP